MNEKHVVNAEVSADGGMRIDKVLRGAIEAWEEFLALALCTNPNHRRIKVVKSEIREDERGRPRPMGAMGGGPCGEGISLDKRLDM